MMPASGFLKGTTAHLARLSLRVMPPISFLVAEDTCQGDVIPVVSAAVGPTLDVFHSCDSVRNLFAALVSKCNVPSSQFDTGVCRHHRYAHHGFSAEFTPSTASVNKTFQ